ncbi:GNAT family N-acetyltransferase [Melissospora conviva]|uniref:GNAT family N-acetyltransferase n=1 Tax=Melissospora conviva TaxID=3388432 RepID=UPI003C19EF8B
MLLRDVELRDVDAYVRIRCDPVMMAELGGPLPQAGIRERVRHDVAAALADTAWIRMIVPDPAAPAVVAGSVVLWTQESDDAPFSEIGWMVLPEFQRRGLGKQAVRQLLQEAHEEERWGEVHAFPSTTNVASNAICRTLGFRLLGEQDKPFAGRLLRANHWVVDTRDGLT